MGGYHFSSVQSCCYIHMLYRHPVFSKLVHHSCTDKGEVARTRLNILILDAFGGALMCLSKDLFLKNYLTNLFSFYMKYTCNECCKNIFGCLYHSNGSKTCLSVAPNQFKLQLSLGFTNKLRRKIL